LAMPRDLDQHAASLEILLTELALGVLGPASCDLDEDVTVGGNYIHGTEAAPTPRSMAGANDVANGELRDGTDGANIVAGEADARSADADFGGSMEISSSSSDKGAAKTPLGSSNSALSSPWMLDSEEDDGAKEWSNSAEAMEFDCSIHDWSCAHCCICNSGDFAFGVQCHSPLIAGNPSPLVLDAFGDLSHHANDSAGAHPSNVVGENLENPVQLDHGPADDSSSAFVCPLCQEAFLDSQGLDDGKRRYSGGRLVVGILKNGRRSRRRGHRDRAWQEAGG